MTQTLERPKTARARTSKPTRASAPPVADEPATQPVDPASEPETAPESTPEPTPEPANPAESAASESLGDPAESAAEVEDEPDAANTDDWDHAKIRERREGLSLSRQQLATLANLSVSRIWRSETPGGQPLLPDQRRAILHALDEVDANGVPESMKPAKGTKQPGLTNATLLSRLKNAREAVNLAGGVKSASDLRHVIALVHHALEGTTPQAPAPKVVEVPLPADAAKDA